MINNKRKVIINRESFLYIPTLVFIQFVYKIFNKWYIHKNKGVFI